MTEARIVWLDRSASEEERSAARSIVQRQLRRLIDATPVTQAINDELRSKLDEIYRKHLDRGDAWKLIGSSHATWVDAYRKYVLDVVDHLRHHVSKWPDSAEKHDATDDVKTAWRDCWSKAKLLLELRPSEFPTQPHHMPFMCVSFWKALSKQLKRVSNALQEVRDASRAVRLRTR